MAHWQLNNKDQASEWYDKSIAWRDKNEPGDRLQGFYDEAEKLLGLDKKDEEKPPAEEKIAAQE